MRRRLLGWVLACLLGGLPAPGSADIYRWTDADGEHFTTDLSKVPRRQRPAARRNATPERPPEPVAESPAAPWPVQPAQRVQPAQPVRQSRPAAPEPDPMHSEACHLARKEINRLRRKAASVRRQVDAAEDGASNIRLSNSSRANYKARAQRYEAQLLDAEDAVSDYENAMRQRGLPRGCLR